jgi:hypothetical protein
MENKQWTWCMLKVKKLSTFQQITIWNFAQNITIPQKTQTNKAPNKSYIQSFLDTQIWNASLAIVQHMQSSGQGVKSSR